MNFDYVIIYYRLLSSRELILITKLTFLFNSALYFLNILFDYSDFILLQIISDGIKFLVQSL